MRKNEKQAWFQTKLNCSQVGHARRLSQRRALLKTCVATTQQISMRRAHGEQNLVLDAFQAFFKAAPES
jgi:hypothetical protein